ARGKPGCPGCTCQIRVRSSLPIAHGAAGAVGARLSLRPLFGRGTTNCKTQAHPRRGNGDVCLLPSVRAKRSNPASRSWRQAGLLRRFAPRNDGVSSADICCQLNRCLRETQTPLLVASTSMLTMVCNESREHHVTEWIGVAIALVSSCLGGTA